MSEPPLPVARRSVGACLLAAPAVAQPRWSPSQPVRVVIPFGPGGSMDPVVRLTQGYLQAELGQPVVVDHRGGGGTVLGTLEVRRAPPDGHTILFVANSFAANVSLRPNLPYDTLRDFAPLVMCVVVPHVLVIHPGVGADFAGLVAAGRQPGRDLAFGSYGIGSSNHLGGEQFRDLARIQATHVPYGGSSRPLPDLLAGRLQFMFANLPDVIQPVRAGQLRAVAISAAARAPDLPEVPTMDELGYSLVLSDSWFGMLMRADVPEGVRSRLEAALLSALAQPDVTQRLGATGYTVLARTGAQFGAELRRYVEAYAQVIRANRIRVE